MNANYSQDQAAASTEPGEVGEFSVSVGAVTSGFAKGKTLRWRDFAALVEAFEGVGGAWGQKGSVYGEDRSRWRLLDGRRF